MRILVTWGGILAPALCWAQGMKPREILLVEDLAPRDQIELPADFQVPRLHRERRMVSRRLSEPVSGAGCTVSLSGSDAPVTLSTANQWTIQSVTELPPTAQDCRSHLHARIRDDYQNAQKSIEQDWITEDPVARSLHKRKLSEKYLRRLDRVQDSGDPCHELLESRERREIRGPAMVKMGNKGLPDRHLYLLCDRRGVRLDVLANEGIRLTPAELASPARATPLPAASRRGGAR